MFTRSRTSWSTILVPLTAALVIVVAICSALYLREANQIANTALDNENRRMERFTGLFANDISAAVSERLGKLGPDARVAVLPQGPLTIPYLA